MNEGVPHVPQSDDPAVEAQVQKEKWISNQLAKDPSKTVEDLDKEYDEERAKILAEGGFDEQEFTQMAGKEGAGTVEKGHKSSLHTDEGLGQ